MHTSARVQGIKDSITLKLNEEATKLSDEGRRIFNLTAGQLPFRPQKDFVDSIESELRFLRSFQYAPVAGIQELRDKILRYIIKTRQISNNEYFQNFDCVISNGAKHSLYNVLGAIINPGDEVVLLAPYWVSYPEMIKFWGGVPMAVKCQNHNAFIPAIEDIQKVLTPTTKAIIINGPNNPTGVVYSDEWMNKFAQLVSEYPNLIILSDEIYRELVYFDPPPKYFYNFNEDLLQRTIIFDGISKSLACTGLRIGYCVAPKPLTKYVSKLQGQTSSGASALMQRALNLFDFDKIAEFLNPIKVHLRNNANVLRNSFRDQGLASSWYQTTGAFYFMVDFAQTPVFQHYCQQGEVEEDFSSQICQDLLQKLGLALVPGGDFGAPNTARLSLVLEEAPFMEAMELLTKFLSLKDRNL